MNFNSNVFISTQCQELTSWVGACAWFDAIISRTTQAMGHHKLKNTLPILIFGNAYFQAAIQKSIHEESIISEKNTV